ncbi:MAG: tetratricopeptide repeat protein [Pseudomonadota bacterium]
MNPMRLFKPLLPVLVCSVASLAQAQTQELDDLFAELQQPDLATWENVETQIWLEWSKSGSAAMDMLLQRGRDAIEAEDYETAVEHLSALIDHAPQFAEGYNARATAYYHLERFGQSIADIQQTLALNPRHFGALAGLASMLEQLGRDRDALSIYRAAHAIHPHRPNVEDSIERLEKELNDIAL